MDKLRIQDITEMSDPTPFRTPFAHSHCTRDALCVEGHRTDKRKFPAEGCSVGKGQACAPATAGCPHTAQSNLSPIGGQAGH